MADDKPRLPLGAADWVTPTEDEIAAAAEITPEVIADAQKWARETVGGDFAALLDAEPMDTDA
jgi:hypothetical protein